MGVLVKCKTCGQQVDSTAKSCPHCGVSKPGKVAKKSPKWLKFIFIFLVSSVISIHLLLKDDAPIETKSEHQLAIESGFSAYDGHHKKLKEKVIESLKDPSSFEHVQTTYIDKDNFIEVHMTYRAKNSFGAITTQSISAVADLNGNIIKIGS